MYNIHVYARNAEQTLIFIDGIAEEIQCEIPDDFSAVEKITYDVLQTGQKIEITINNCYDLKDDDDVYFPIWSLYNGQDDIRWYKATSLGNYKWGVELELKDHNFESGKFIVHTYVRNENNILELVSNTEFEANDSFRGNVEIVNKNNENGTFEVELTNFDMPIQNLDVFAAVWSAANGQDDIIWYPCNIENNTVKAKIDAAMHDYCRGIYFVHVYYRDAKGTLYFSDATEVLIDYGLELGMPNLVLRKDTLQSKIIATIFNVTDSNNVKSIDVPAWSVQNGQDDLVWHSAKPIDDTTWRVEIPIEEHQYDTGIFAVHAYKRTSNDQLEFLDGDSIAIDGIKCAENIHVTDTDAELGRFKVNISQIESPAKIKSVVFAVWSDKNGQDDIRWYNADYSNGQWQVQVDGADHKIEEGLCHIHCYATDERGVTSFIAASTKNIHITKITMGDIGSQVTAKAWIIYDKNNKRTLYGKNIDTKMQLASQTKIMTGLVVLDYIKNLDEQVTMTKTATSGMPWDTSMAGLVVGKKYTVRNLMEGMLVYSGGDCAGLLAEYVAGSQEKFVKLMNEKAKSLGMTNTYFTDVVGLFNNYSTPREFMKLVDYATDNQTFMAFVGKPSCVIADVDGYKRKLLYNSNNLVRGTLAYDKSLYTVNGIKTGYTDEAGFCLTGSAYNANGDYMFATAFASRNLSYRAIDVRTMFDYVFSK